MDKYKIELTKSGKYAVFTRDYFWQRWKPVTAPAIGEPVKADNIQDALRFVGSTWWKEFRVRVDSIGVF